MLDAEEHVAIHKGEHLDALIRDIIEQPTPITCTYRCIAVL